MFKFLTSKMTKDSNMPERVYTLSCLDAVLNGTLYDALKYPFIMERNNENKYIPINERRPSVRYNLCQVVVNDSTSMLFGDNHAPEIGCEDAPTKEALKRLIKETGLIKIMLDAAMRGSIGTAVIWFRVLKGKLFFDYVDSRYLTPEYDTDDPLRLIKITELYKTTGKALIAAGYKIDKSDEGAAFWFSRVWDTKREIWYLPLKVLPGVNADSGLKFVEDGDTSKTRTHGFDFTPMVWIKNLPGGVGIDGYCTFRNAIDTSIETEYLLSQGSRGIKYNASPTIVMKSDNTTPAEVIVGDAIQVPTTGDAHLMETTGGSTDAVINMARFLRELALEAAGGNRTDSSKLATATSGRAMEMMNQGLIWLVGKLRSSYGEHGLIELLNMVIIASDVFDLIYKDGSEVPEMKKGAQVVLMWPPYQPPTMDDQVQLATALDLLVEGGIISAETATGVVATTYNIEDTQAELTRIKGEQADKQQSEISLAQATKPAVAPPTAKPKAATASTRKVKTS